NDPHQNANYTRSGNSGGMHSDNNDDHIEADTDFTAIPPQPGYVLAEPIRLVSAKTGGGDAQFQAKYAVVDGAAGKFRVMADFLNFGGGRIINLTFSLTWNPPLTNAAHE